ncbi:MAG: SDR family NAD(P)-dependent oxidoreductase, partial [bacterium]|nr:SDR family NAD(P)-dependent oxidoreductase [bacterium]MDW8163421.1 SDR family NAD(P)-dependent oxidoreductase [Candidatus Omnitrophota bacterium]
MIEINLENYAGIVTGGAGGIGKAIVEKIIQAHGKVMIADINEKEGEKTVEELKKRGEIYFFKTDVSKQKEVLN